MKVRELRSGLGASGRRCGHSICPTRMEGHMRRRLLFVTALVTSLVAGVVTTANRPAVAAPIHVTMTVRPFAWGCGPGGNFGQCSVPSGLSGVTAIAAGMFTAWP